MCLSGRCVLVCCCIAGPVIIRIWPVVLCRHLCPVTQGPAGPRHCVCRAAPLVLSVWCRTTWCCAVQCTVCALLHGSCGHKAVGFGTPAMQCHTARRIWAVELLQRSASLLGVSRHVGSGTPSTHCLTAWGQWAEELLQCATPLPWGSGQCNPCNPQPLYPGAVGSATPVLHGPTARGAGGSGNPGKSASLPRRQWAVELLLCTATPPWGRGQCNPCTTLPHCLGAVGNSYVYKV